MNRCILLGSLVAALTLTTGCGASSVQDRPAGGPTGSGPASAARRPNPSSVPPAELDSLARSNNVFGLTLWSKLRSRTGNMAVSPASISLALGMTYGGARGETAAQMKRTLALTLPDDRVHAGLGDTIARWNGTGDRGYELKVANRLFADRSTTFVPEFLALTRDAYRAPAEPVDFQGAPDPSRERINHWVEGQTRDRIRDLLPQGSITSDVRLVLVNAIYFKGAWARRFEERDTRDGRFQVTASRSVNARMMSQTATFGYAEVDGVKVLEMPYVGDDLSMIVALPAEPGLDGLEANLDAPTFERWVAAVRPTEELLVSMPRFKIDPSDPLMLSAQLADMGMPLAFASAADFTGMLPREGGPLWISEVFHKAFVEVNEQGTEAAAATAVVMQTEDAVAERPTFVADHPFLFFVRDRHTGAILFMGRVVEPRA